MRNGPYILVKAPPEYPGKKYRETYVYEHQLVWWQNTGQLVPKGYLIHHKDDDKTHNAFENLELKTVSLHTADHNRQRKIPDIVIQCVWCEESFELLYRIYKFKTKNGQKNFFCCRSHQVRHQQAQRKSIPDGAM